MKTRLLSGACAAALLVAACSEDDPLKRPPLLSANGGSAGTNASAGRGGDAQAGSFAAGTAGSGGSTDTGSDGDGGGAAGMATVESWTDCQGSDQAFVRRALFAVMGRRPVSQAEVNVYTDLIAAIDRLEGVDPKAKRPAGADLKHSRKVAVEAMMSHVTPAGNDYLWHWLDVYRDNLRVQRTEEMANPSCYDVAMRDDGAKLAAYVRDNPASSPGDGGGPFTMRDLIRSSLELDDVSPMYVGNLFSMLWLTYYGANVDDKQLELARRSDFGAWFDGVYLHRDGVCLGCHNSEASVTFDPNPAKNRWFPLPGKLEKPLFVECDADGQNCVGGSTGPEPKDGYDGITRMHAPLRYKGFADQDNGTAAPWGWYNDDSNPQAPKGCGVYTTRENLTDDIAGVDAKFGKITGTKTSAWDLADSLQAGFAKLRAHGLTRGPNGEVPDADEAFAYLVSANIAELAWKEVMGTPLTIANYFPRNSAARDELFELTEGFIASGFSNKALLLAIFRSPAFNLLAPDAGCGSIPYPMPPLFDPWVIADDDPSRRGNGVSDGVAPISSRTLLAATYKAMGWAQLPPTFPLDRSTPEAEFQAEIGIFLKNAEPGFRGFDFQARLGWEDRMGRCANQNSDGTMDYIDVLAAQAKAKGDATVGDMVAALKDHLIGDARVDAMTEQPAIEALMGASLGDDAFETTGLSDKLRLLCGVLVSSPQYLLSGIEPKDATVVPKMTPPDQRYDAVCQAIQTAGLTDGLKLTCNGQSLTVGNL